MLELWRKRLDISSLGFEHEDPAIFTRSQWQTKKDPDIYYLSYRLVVTVYLVIAWILSVIDPDNLHEPYPFHLKWFIYLTNWGFTLCLAQALLCSTMLVARYSKMRKGELAVDPEMGPRIRLYKLYWFTFSVALDLSFAVTILYWIAIFDPSKDPVDFLNVIMHCTNSLVMLLELCVVAHPVRLSHFYVPVTTGLSFTIFSLLYYFAGGTSRLDDPYIYPPVDWRKPVPTTLVCLGACVLLMILHCGTYVVYRIRLVIAHKLMALNDEAAIPVEDQFRALDNNHNDTV